MKQVLCSVGFFFLVYCTNAHSQQQADKVSKYAEDVILHVVLHEIGHGLIREFDLPVLGNDETMADALATHYLTHHLPILDEIRYALTSFDWHSQVTIDFIQGDGSSYWSRSNRTITVYSENMERFMEQARHLQ